MMTLQESLTGLSPVFFESAARGAGSGNSESFDLFSTRQLVVTLSVSSATGTLPTLDVRLQHSADGVEWFDVDSGAFAQFTDTGAATITISAFHRYVRAAYTIAGTNSSFTFSVKGTAK